MTQPPEFRPKPARRWAGPLAVALIVGVAVAMAAFSWQHRFFQGRRPLALWGPVTVEFVQNARNVELLVLGEQTGTPVQFEGVEARFVIVRRQDIGAAPGLVHARQALLDDASFLWDQPAPLAPWKYAVIFQHQEGVSAILFSADCRTVQRSEGGPTATLRPHIAKGFQDLFERELARE